MAAGAIYSSSCDLAIQGRTTFADSTGGSFGGELQETPRRPPPMTIAVERGGATASSFVFVDFGGVKL